MKAMCIERLEGRAMLAANLVKDILTTPTTSGSDPANIVQIGTTSFFTANVRSYGTEIWKSDGTAAGTELVKDIFPGEGGVAPRYLTNVNGVLYFRAIDGVNGLELWKSDGTEAGTVLVKDIALGTASSSPSQLINVNGVLYFQATDGISGVELWKSDGTAAGTVLVQDISPGSGSSGPVGLTVVNSTLYFAANDGANGHELWKSNGTAAGTVQVKDIRVGSGSSLSTSLNYSTITNMSGTLYFQANDGTTGAELWKSDGTAAGTVQVKDILVGTNGSAPVRLTNVGGTLYFRATENVNGNELWKSNGTTAGTVLVKDILAGTGSGNPDILTNLNGTLLFRANDTAGGYELWKSNGTAAGTIVVKDIRSGSYSSLPNGLTNANGTLYFRANDGANGDELWKSDGTNAGTVLVNDIRAGSTGSNPSYLANVNGTLFLRADNGLNGSELWKSDGTITGTVLVKDIVSGNLGALNYATYAAPKNLNGTLIFRAATALWASDGTSAGTIPLGTVQPFYLTEMNGSIYFYGVDSANDAELWKSDGTVAGTQRVKDIRAGASSGSPVGLVNVNSTLYFHATDGSNTGLWKSDGTDAGTTFVKSVSIGFNSLTNVNGTLYFAGSNGNGTELWTSDGTTAGTVMVKDIQPGAGSGYPRSIVNVNGTVYFAANDGSNGTELWKSDGSASGTLLVRDIFVGTSSSSANPTGLINLNGTLFFQANDGTNGVELWKSDGTFTGTTMVKNISPGSTSSYPINLTNRNGVLVFRANDGASGAELWKSDGSAAGTVLLKDIWSGVAGSTPFTTLELNYITNVNGWIVLNANDGVHGQEVWISDGTTQGTRLLADVLPGSGASLAQQFVQVNSQLLFHAIGSGIGRELWSIPLPQYSLTNGVLTVDLSSSTSHRNLTIKSAAGGLSIFDSVTNADILDPNSEFPVSQSAVQELRIIGSNSFSENIIVDHSIGDVVNIAQGIDFDGGSGGTDTVTIIGAAGVDAILSQSPTDLDVTSGNGTAIVPFKFRNAESLVVSNMRRISVAGNLNVSIPITVSHQSPFDLSGVTSLVGGSITSNGTVALGSGEFITGAGTIAGRFAAEAGSSLVATGNMTLGNASSTAGFLSRGELDVSTSTVTLLDANQAVLGSLTTLGNATSIGTLSAANGVLIDFGNNLTGYGTLSTPNLAAKPTIINGNVDGTSLANPTTLSGYIKGVGSLNNVSITGTYSPGFSPATVTLGSVNYTASAITTIELGGTQPGTQHDQLNHVGQALLGGTLDLQLINGYQPSLGDSFTILTSTGGITGTFSSINLPTLAPTLGWQVSTSASAVVVSLITVNVAPSDIVISSSTMRENLSVGSAVGAFSSVDANSGNTFVYALVSGSGDSDNAKFSIDGTGSLRNASALDFETQNIYSIRVRSTDQGGLFTDKVFAISLVDMPELVGTPIFADGTNQRSLVKQMTLTFDGSITIGANAISINKRGAQGGAVTTNVSSSVNGLGQTILQLTFGGAFTRNGALVDGFYELSLNGNALTRGAESLDANQDGIGGDNFVMGASEADKFFALYGDIDGDGLVGVAEFGQFRSAFGKSSSQSGYDPRFDYESDSGVGISDFGQFRTRFGKPKMQF